MLTSGVPLSADLELQRQLRLEALKAHVAEMFAQGRGAEAMDQVVGAMAQLERHNEQLAWRIIRADRYRFGRSTEKLTLEQLRQLVLSFNGDETTLTPDGEPAVPAPPEPEQVDGPAAQTDPDPAAAPGAPPAKPRKKRKRVQSMKVGADVERNVNLVLVPEDERSCALCGGEKKVFDHIDYERIRYVPAKIVLDVDRCEKMACEECRKDVSVAVRENPPAVVRKVDGSLLAKLVAEKCVLGLPLDRQRRELKRLGLDCPDKTIQSYWNYTVDLIEPVADATMSLVFGKAIVGADDSHLRTLDVTAKSGTFRGHLWCFVGTDGAVGGLETIGYGYTPSWEATEISDWFAAIDGDIQCDGYAGYSSEVEDEDGLARVAVPPERRLGCGMHIRGKFIAALDARDARAAVAIRSFADLYLIEADCKVRGLDADARGEERRARSLPILTALDEWVDRIHPLLLPKSPLRRATTYAINQREFFRRCFTDGRFEIDNGRVERRIRMFAVARRNFLFTGSVRGGERLAAAFTLVDNCLAIGIDPERYLIDIIEKLERGLPMRRLSELIPQNWAAEHAAENRAE
ncbi:MAG: IS66 family transposase [Chloroflexota bacterium]|nr:IS66 family transposase [Chloroflexota bacterium]